MPIIICLFKYLQTRFVKAFDQAKAINGCLELGTKKSIRDSVFLPYTGLMRSIRDERWKLIVYPPINHRELFDLKNDPDETKSLADDPTHVKEIDRLTVLLKAWQQRVGDKQPLTVAKPKPKEISFDGYVRKVDQWQPDWVRKKYFP